MDYLDWLMNLFSKSKENIIQEDYYMQVMTHTIQISDNAETEDDDNNIRNSGKQV